jgi:hypothetical protein
MWSCLSLGRLGLGFAGTTRNPRLWETVTAWRGPTVSLVTLSACETGIPEVNGVPSESLSLGSAWLVPRALAAVSSSWIVDGFCTLKLMTRFYAGYFNAEETRAVRTTPLRRWAKCSAGSGRRQRRRRPAPSRDSSKCCRARARTTSNDGDAKRRAFRGDARSRPALFGAVLVGRRAGFGVSGL